MKPNPIRSGHYGEMSWRGSDGEREILGITRGGGELGTNRERERKMWTKRWKRQDNDLKVRDMDDKSNSMSINVRTTCLRACTCVHM